MNGRACDFVGVDYRGRRTVTGGAWQDLFGERAFGVLVMSDATSAYDIEARDRSLGDDDVIMRDRSVDGETTVNYDFSWQAAPAWTLRGGGSWKRLRRRLFVVQPRSSRPLNPYRTLTVPS